MAKKSGAAAAAADGLSFELDAGNLREVLTAAKEFNPTLARGLRKRLRTVGNDIIAEQRQVLAGPKPPGVAVAGKTTRLVYRKDTGKPYLRRVNVYEERERVARDYKGGLRRRIGQGLKTRVVTGKTRQGVAVRTTRRTEEMSVGYQSKIFRHPVFAGRGRGGGGSFVYQRGMPYFWGPALRGRTAAARKIDEALADAINEIAKG